MAPMAPDAALAALGPRIADLDAAWLTGRRWFRSKARPLAEVTLADAAQLDGTWLLVLAARFADGGRELYLVPAVADGDALREPGDGEGAWREIARRIVAGPSQAAGVQGLFRFEPTPAGRELLTSDGEVIERRFTVEQSNTSVRLGDRAVLKIYRLLEPGTNPELEVNAFLTRLGFRYAPVLGGTLSYETADGEPAAAAMLQQLVASRGDGWDWALRSLTAPPDGPLRAIAGASQIGGVTAELHAALAARPEEPGFPAREATGDELEAWRASAERQLEAALGAVAGPQAEELRRLAPRIRERFAAITDVEGARLSRIHGDYHLGQLLRTEEGFMVVDFEGEPARLLDERRAPASPLRDVAGMLRSFDYAARTAERQASAGSFDAGAWVGDARGALLNAYGLIGSSEETLLAAFELEKACYEVVYEANNRPDWTWLPLGALERLGR
jgi:trehalose synthase-fused probable maltokinase